MYNDITMNFRKGIWHMNCLRCGRETADQQVFCNGCLDDMARHPVKSDTPIYLPNRKATDAPKKHRRQKKERSPEEIIESLRKRIRFLTAVCLILFMMLTAAAAGVWLAMKQGAQIPMANIGQNFQTVTDIFNGINED